MMRRSVPGWVAAAGLVAVLGACATSTPTGVSAAGSTTPSAAPSTPHGTPTAPTPAVTVTATVTTTTATAFTDGTRYYVWIDADHSGPATVHIRVGEHLVDTPTDKAATKYLTSHGQTVSPDGVPDDYINVDLNKAMVVPVSSTVVITINPEGVQQTLTESKFFTWLGTNLATPIAPSDRDAYPGAPRLAGPLFAVSFHAGTIVTIDQVFEP